MDFFVTACLSRGETRRASEGNETRRTAFASRALVQESVEAADGRVNRRGGSPRRMVIGRHASRDGNGSRCGGKREIVERVFREFGGCRLALRRRRFDPAIAVAVEVRARRRRRVRHAVMRVVAGFAPLVDSGQCARAHRTGPGHGNGEGGCDDWLPIAHRDGVYACRDRWSRPLARKVDSVSQLHACTKRVCGAQPRVAVSLRYAQRRADLAARQHRGNRRPVEDGNPGSAAQGRSRGARSPDHALGLRARDRLGDAAAPAGRRDHRSP